RWGGWPWRSGARQHKTGGALASTQAPRLEGETKVTVTAERATASSTRETMTMTVGDFLLRRIQEAGDVLVAEDGTSYDTMIFIESIMDPFDAPTAVMMSGNNGADIDYGPRGPQHRPGMVLRPAT
ncbi:MAG TPA: hypothetical protein VKH61_21265, partial [Streptosporangiaceae bacterium]|nr:hypothetical protein [Streptosporangiaceae bacterium]